MTELLQHQINLELLYNKNQLHKRIKNEFLSMMGENGVTMTDLLNDHEIPLDFGYDLLVQMCLYKRTTPDVMIGILRKHFDHLGPRAGQATADMLRKCVEMDLVDYNSDTRQLIIVFDISEEVQEELDRFQFPLPMVVPPRPVRTNRDTGYVTGSNSVILRGNHTEDDVCLDHLNRVNQIKFSIDVDTAMMIKNQWRNLDKQKDGETRSDFEKRCKAFDKFDRTAKDVIGTLTELSNEHYMTHRYDKRGRTYVQGYHINYQGTPWSKAIIQLAEKEIVQ